MTGTGTDLAPYADGHAQLVMTPDAARALDEQVRRCTEAVLREGTDYGFIPGTGGDKTLWRPGAQKLLQWFGLGYSCERVEVERDEQGRKHGITYKCTVARRLPDGTLDVKATCEGTADYDEAKFYQSAEEVQRKAEAKERMWAKKDGRVANPTKWKDLPEYRADWNALMKRAQKRAIVGAVTDATAAGGIFTDREEDDTPAPDGDEPTWYEQALETALTFTSQDDGRTLYVQAAQAARDGLCTPRQAGHVQNRIRQRVQKLKNVTVTDVEDLGRRGGDETAAAGDDTQAGPGPAPAGTGDPQERKPGDPRAAGTASPRGAPPLPPLPGEDDADSAPAGAMPHQRRNLRAAGAGEDSAPAVPDETAPSGPAAGTDRPDESDHDTPGTATRGKGGQLTALWTVLSTEYAFTSEEKAQARKVCEHIIGRELAGATTGNLSWNEACTVLDTLANWRETAQRNQMEPREFLIELMATAEKEGGDGE